MGTIGSSRTVGARLNGERVASSRSSVEPMSAASRAWGPHMPGSLPLRQPLWFEVYMCFFVLAESMAPWSHSEAMGIALLFEPVEAFGTSWSHSEANGAAFPYDSLHLCLAASTHTS